MEEKQTPSLPERAQHYLSQVFNYIRSGHASNVKKKKKKKFLVFAKNSTCRDDRAARLRRHSQEGKRSVFDNYPP